MALFSGSHLAYPTIQAVDEQAGLADLQELEDALPELSSVSLAARAARKVAPNPVGREASLTRIKGMRSKPGSRRRRRWENACFLRDLAPMTDEEFAAEYMIDTESLFRHLFTDATALEQWLDFVTLPMDQQTRLLRQHPGGAPVVPSRKEVAEQRAARGFQLTSHQAFLRIDRNIRSMLKKQAIPLGLLQGLEERLLVFFVDETAAGDSDASATSVPPLVLTLESSFERMLMHGLAQYHGLTSESTESPSGRRTTTISFAGILSQRPTVLLSDYLGWL